MIFKFQKINKAKDEDFYVCSVHYKLIFSPKEASLLKKSFSIEKEIEFYIRLGTSSNSNSYVIGLSQSGLNENILVRIIQNNLDITKLINRLQKYIDKQLAVKNEKFLKNNLLQDLTNCYSWCLDNNLDFNELVKEVIVNYNIKDVLEEE